MSEQQNMNFWDAEFLNSSDKIFKYVIGHACGHDPNVKREILIQFHQPALVPNDKPICIARIAITPQHAQELILNLQNQISQIRGNEPPHGRF